MQGNDTILGGNDVLIGGKGNDRLIGGNGADVFNFAANQANGTDKIIGFQDGLDKIRMASSYDFDDLTLKAKNGGALIKWDLGSAFLDGVSKSDIAADDFLF